MSRANRYTYVHVFPVCIHPHLPRRLVVRISRNGVYMACISMRLWHITCGSNVLWGRSICAHLMILCAIHSCDVWCTCGSRMYGKYCIWLGSLDLLDITRSRSFVWISCMTIFVALGISSMFFQHFLDLEGLLLYFIYLVVYDYLFICLMMILWAVCFFPSRNTFFPVGKLMMSWMELCAVSAKMWQ